jgi:hypothetical protein
LPNPQLCSKHRGRLCGSVSSNRCRDDENRPAATTEEIINICAQIGAPEIGMPRVQWAEEIIRAQTLCMELLGGTVCERVIFPHLTPLAALHDQLEARALASVACASRDSIDAMLTYAEPGAEWIIRGQLGVVSALIDALVDKGTLMADEVDLIIRDTIARKLMAAEHDRRKQWQRVLANAATKSRELCLRAT